MFAVFDWIILLIIYVCKCVASQAKFERVNRFSWDLDLNLADIVKESKYLLYFKHMFSMGICIHNYLLDINLLLISDAKVRAFGRLKLYTGYTQKNGAVSKVNKKSISHLTRAQRTQLDARWRRSRKRLSVCSVSFLNRARNSRCIVITDLNTSKRSTQKAFSCCDAILETGPAAPQ